MHIGAKISPPAYYRPLTKDQQRLIVLVFETVSCTGSQDTGRIRPRHASTEELILLIKYMRDIYIVDGCPKHS